MKKIAFLSILLFCFTISGYSQITQLYVGFGAYFLHDIKKNTFTYYTTDQPIGILMNINRQVTNKYYVGFPDSTDTFELTVEGGKHDGKLYCEYPNGTKQIFFSPIANLCHQLGEEVIVGAGPPITYIYFSPNYPSGVLLKIVGGDLMREIPVVEVSFPNDDKVYELRETPEKLEVKSPDGVVQIFLQKK